jgi:hypothetical protein
MTEWRPPLIDAMHNAPAATFRAAASDERAAAEAWIRERKAQAAARRQEQRVKMRRIVDLALSGATIAEIAPAVGMSPRTIRRIGARLGLRLGRETTGRRLIVAPIAPEQAGVLERLAAAYGDTKERTLFTLLRYLLDDEAHIARRLLHLQQSDMKQAGGAPARDATS